MSDLAVSIFQLIVLTFSVMIHEVSHGAVAYHLGDDTAKRMNRLNLNPLNHIDPFGSVILPLILILARSPILFGWAKPVPYNPNNLKNPLKSAAIIGAAGPSSNLLIALIFGLIIRLIVPLVGSHPVLLFLDAIVYVNIFLAIFNLVPIPPLDGSKILFALLPSISPKAMYFLEQYGMWILIIFLFFGMNLISPIVNSLHYFLVGF